MCAGRSSTTPTYMERLAARGAMVVQEPRRYVCPVKWSGAAPHLPHEARRGEGELCIMPSQRHVQSRSPGGSTPLSRTYWSCAPDEGKQHLTSNFTPIRGPFRRTHESPSGAFPAPRLPHVPHVCPTGMAQNGIPRGVSVEEPLASPWTPGVCPRSRPFLCPRLQRRPHLNNGPAGRAETSIRLFGPALSGTRPPAGLRSQEGAAMPALWTTLENWTVLPPEK